MAAAGAMEKCPEIGDGIGCSLPDLWITAGDKCQTECQGRKISAAHTKNTAGFNAIVKQTFSPVQLFDDVLRVTQFGRLEDDGGRQNGCLIQEVTLDSNLRGNGFIKTVL